MGPEGGVGHLQGRRHDRGGSQGREQNSCHPEDRGREDLVHTRSLGTWWSQDQERGQGRGRYGHRPTRIKEGQEGDGQVNYTPVLLLYYVRPIIVRGFCLCVN